MNRHQRRKAEKLTRSMKLDRVVAIHEAGHAVARVLTASDMGLKPEEAVAYIQIGGDIMSAHSSHDGQATLISQAITYGPMFSDEISAHMHDRDTSREALLKIVSDARAAGADIERWATAKALISVFASAAEAKLRGLPLLDVWESYQSENDMRDMARDCGLAGLDDEGIDAVEQAALALASEFIEVPEVWRAVLAVADALPNRGELHGPKIASIVEQAMEGGK